MERLRTRDRTAYRSHSVRGRLSYAGALAGTLATAFASPGASALATAGAASEAVAAATMCTRAAAALAVALAAAGAASCTHCGRGRPGYSAAGILLVIRWRPGCLSRSPGRFHLLRIKRQAFCQQIAAGPGEQQGRCSSNSHSVVKKLPAIGRFGLAAFFVFAPVECHATPHFHCRPRGAMKVREPAEESKAQK